MTVYIVWHMNFNSEDEFIGVFSSEEKAQDYIEWYPKSDQRDFHIETTELDDY